MKAVRILMICRDVWRRFPVLWLGLALLSSCGAEAAELIPVQPLKSCFLCSSEPSLTLFWPGVNPKAVLIVIPGGEGYLHFKAGMTEPRNEFFRSLGGLADPKQSRGQLDVVLLDSPQPLSPHQQYPSAREGADHLIRIESAIRYYRDKTHLPVWLMGHSNGGISLAAFLPYAQQQGESDWVAGVIASNIRTESTFKPPINIPFLFLHDRNDQCRHTLLAASQASYDTIKSFDPAPTAFVEVESAQPQAGNPCSSGYHMYHGAGAEVVRDIDQFVASVNPSTPQGEP